MKKSYEPKPLFLERMKELLGNDFEEYWKTVQTDELRSIRVNTLKISPKELKKKLEDKGWKIYQPFKDYPEVMVIEGKIVNEKSEDNNVAVKGAGRSGSGQRDNVTDLEPGELGRALEHLLGYYYVQEIASMLPVIALKPKKDEVILDLCAAPGSKTSQLAAKMENTGTIIANDLKLGRMKILASNLERCGASNVIITKQDGIELCKRLKRASLKEVYGQGTLVPYQFDKILIDAPCSGEGTIRSTPKTLLMWNIKKIKSLSRLQKGLLAYAIEILKPKGEIVYSTCTHAPEENEEVIDFVLKKYDNIKMEKIFIPVKTTPGIKKWKDKEYLEDIKFTCRIYPHISNTEGFFIAKLRKGG